MATDTDRKSTAKGAKQEYVVLDPSQRLAIAREYLRGREDEHFRAVLAATPDDDLARLEPLEAVIARAQEEVKKLSAEVEG